MKKGEKRVLWAVLVAGIGVLALTTWLEMQYQARNPMEVATTLANEDLRTTRVSGPGAAIIPRGLNPDDLPDPDGRGATLLTLYGVQCHDLPTPLMHSAEEWELVIQRMRERMQARRGGMLRRVIMPPEKDWLTLDAYLKAFAQKPLDASQLQADLETPAGQAFQATCSRCHAAPDPAQHSVREWPRVVLRMKYNMQAAGLSVPDAETTEQIITFLQGHST